MVRLFSHLITMLGMLTFVAGCQTMTGETVGQNIDDASITTAVKAKLAGDHAGNLIRVGVETVRNTVYLTGVVTSQDYKERAGQLAREVKGVKDVVNNLQVQRTER